MAIAFEIKGHHVHPGMRQKDFIKIVLSLGGKVEKVGGRSGADLSFRFPGYSLFYRCGNNPGKDVGAKLVNWLRNAIGEEEAMTQKNTKMGLVAHTIFHEIPDSVFQSHRLFKILENQLTTKQINDTLSHLRKRGCLGKDGYPHGTWEVFRDKLGAEINQEERVMAEIPATPIEPNPEDKRPDLKFVVNAMIERVALLMEDLNTVLGLLEKQSTREKDLKDAAAILRETLEKI